MHARAHDIYAIRGVACDARARVIANYGLTHAHTCGAKYIDIMHA